MSRAERKLEGPGGWRRRLAAILRGGAARSGAIWPGIRDGAGAVLGRHRGDLYGLGTAFTVATIRRSSRFCRAKNVARGRKRGRRKAGGTPFCAESNSARRAGAAVRPPALLFGLIAAERVKGLKRRAGPARYRTYDNWPPHSKFESPHGATYKSTPRAI